MEFPCSVGAERLPASPQVKILHFAEIFSLYSGITQARRPLWLVDGPMLTAWKAFALVASCGHCQRQGH